ncbi:MAG TPA: SDR family NAD(P)-dependent oxidoreductase [Dehalococcoidia bacterium]|jgi:UDP-glucose 4-epimerase
MTRILVTGGAGFIGSHLVDRLVRNGHDVLLLDNLHRARAPKLKYPAGCGAAAFVEGDIRDTALLSDVMRGCETIYHLAAQSNVMGAIDDAQYSFSTNTLGTFNVLRAAADAGARRVVFTSSREVYGESGYVPVDEDHPLAAKNPYGASKVAGEAYARTFAHCYGLDVAILRLANVYGPGDRDRVIPLWLEEAAAGRDLQVYGGSQVLDFIWIDTIIDALTYAGEFGLPGPTNIGTGVGTSILELASRILEVTGSRSSISRLAARGVEVTRFVADISRMRALGLEPEADPLAHLPAMADEFAVGIAV